jgi:hypothetical protein
MLVLAMQFSRGRLRMSGKVAGDGSSQALLSGVRDKAPWPANRLRGPAGTPWKQKRERTTPSGSSPRDPRISISEQALEAE